jgi:hypothetical protein
MDKLANGIAIFPQPGNSLGMNDTSTITEAEILQEVIGADQGDLTPEVAQSVLRWKFTDRAVTRINDLAARNNQGTTTDAEREELAKYLRVGSLVNIIQAKARVSLKRSQAAS